VDDRLLVVDGFTSAAALAHYRQSTVRSAAAVLRRLSADAVTLCCPSHPTSTPLFARFTYDNGHAAWTLTPAFRRLFIVPCRAVGSR
jgi:hypothetical protein